MEWGGIGEKVERLITDTKKISGISYSTFTKKEIGRVQNMFQK